MCKYLLSLLTIIIVAAAAFLYEMPQKTAVLESPKLGAAIHLINERHNLQSALQMLKQAKQSILIANYAYNNPLLLQVINQKAKEGVKVTVIYDRGRSGDWISNLNSSVIKITRKGGEGYLHHKIIVVDGKDIWFSSTNFDSFNAKNITIAFESAEIGMAITREMDAIAGIHSRFRIQPVSSVVDGQRIELFLLPHNNPREHQPIETAMNEIGRRKLLSLINQAKTKIRASVVVFTYKDVAIALANAVKRGVDVSFVGSNIDSDVQDILTKGNVPFKRIKGPYHHKWMLVDDKILWNGSANWSRSAFSRTDDSVLVLYDLTPDQVQFFQEVWQDLMRSSL